MRKFLLMAPVVGALSLGGCGTTGNTPADIQQLILQVQAAAVQVCSFLPTAETITAIISAGNPVVGTATAVANAICAAVTAKSARLGETAPQVNGVPIHGTFVRRARTR